MKSVAVIDYGMGNLHSVAHALRSLDPNLQVQVTGDAALIREADRVIFPGVGAMRDCMAEIRRLGLDQLLPALMRDRPVLAICVGMQALMQSSEENGHVDCLGIFAGDVRRFGGGGELLGADGERLKVPHMGWNCVRQQGAHPLWQGIEENSRFYFVHSYYVAPADDSIVAGTTDYGLRFAAALQRDNLFAVQFHPEKSHRVGLQLLRNFLSWDGSAA